VNRLQDRRDDAAPVRDQDHATGHDAQQVLQPPGIQRGQEPLRHGLPFPAADLHPRPTGGHVLARAPGDLSHRGRRFADGLGDLRIGHIEDLAKHEHGPLDGCERLEHGQHRDRDALREFEVLGHTGTGQQRLREPLPHVVLAAAREGAQPVEALAGDGPQEIRPRLTHLGAVDAGPAQPGLLQHVLGIGRAAEHLVGDGEQQVAVDHERVVGPGLMHHTGPETMHHTGHGLRPHPCALMNWRPVSACPR